VAGLFDAVTQAFMPAPAYTLRVSATTAQCAAVFGKPLVSSIVTQYEAGEEPFLLVNRFGEGANYLALQSIERSKNMGMNAPAE
jgi:hypothetical protein